MTTNKRVKIDPRGLIAYSLLPPDEQQHLRTILAEVSARPLGDEVDSRIGDLAGVSGHFLLYLSDDLWVIFRREEDGTCVVLNIVLREMIERYFAPIPEPLPVS